MTDYARRMLDTLYDVFYEKHSDYRKAWDNMLAFIAGFHNGKLMAQFESELSWITQHPGMLEKVRSVYDPLMLREDRGDVLGEMYFDNQLDKSQQRAKSYARTPIDLVEAMAKAVLPHENGGMTLIDPSAGTGRLLLALARRAPEGVYLGVEDDLKLSRIALTNLLTHNIKGCILNANCYAHAVDPHSDAGKHNWQYANRWYSQMHNLLPPLPVNN